MESIVGGRWFAVAGAIAVLVAIVLFLKLAYTQGWLGRISPPLRCIFGAGFGIALLASGELARKRINAWAAVGLLSAGVAGLYASALAAYSLYHLFSDAAAFALLAFVSAIGIATGARSRLPAVSIVSVIGAYLVPFVLESPNPSPFVFPIYSLAILATGLTLAAWLRGGFRAVGAIVWWGTLALGGLWISDVGETHPIIALCFAAIAWAMVHASHIVATRTPEEPPNERERHLAWQATIPAHQLWMLSSSFSYSTWATMLAVEIAQTTGIIPDWAPAFALSGVTATLAFALIPSLKLLREIPSTGRERLGTALLAQTGALIIAGTALAAFGIAAVPTWLALGIAAILAGRIIRARALDAYGVIAMSIGTARLFAHDFWQGTLNTPHHHILGIAISDALWWAVGVGAGWLCACVLLLWRLPQQSSQRPLAGFALGIAILSLMSAPLLSNSETGSTLWAWIALTTITLAASPLRRTMKLNWSSAAACIPCLLLWLFAHVLPDFDWSNSAHTLFLHPGLWSALALAALLGFHAWRGLNDVPLQHLTVLRSFALWLAAALVFTATSLEVARIGASITGDHAVQLAFVSIWWSIVAVALIVVGFKINTTAARHTGLALMAIAMLKVVLYDMGGVPQVWRIASFLLLGLLMIGIAAGYSRVASRLVSDPGR